MVLYERWHCLLGVVFLCCWELWLRWHREPSALIPLTLVRSGCWQCLRYLEAKSFVLPFGTGRNCFLCSHIISCYCADPTSRPSPQLKLAETWETALGSLTKKTAMVFLGREQEIFSCCSNSALFFLSRVISIQDRGLSGKDGNRKNSLIPLYQGMLYGGLGWVDTPETLTQQLCFYLRCFPWIKWPLSFVIHMSPFS